MQVTEVQVKEELQRFGADIEYLQEHREELLGRYPERWVAVYNLQVVAAARDIKTLIRKLDRKGVPPEHTYCEYLTDNEPLLILSAPR